MIELILYSRTDCELCHEMELVVKREMARFEARLEKVDIDGNPELKRRFNEEVPVLFVNGRKAFKYRCTQGELRKRLSREVGRRWPFGKAPTA